MSNQELTFEEYNDNSYSVRGDKKKYAKKLKDIGGRWNPRMKGGEGWLVPKENLDNLKNLLTSVNSNETGDMEELPIILHVKNKDIFSTLFYNKVFCYLRKSIYEHVISKDENSFFDLEQFGKLYFNDNTNRVDLITKLSTEIQLELKELGWNCKLSYGGTALFIYSTDNPPPSCWDDGLQ